MIKILVIDDEEAILELVKRGLEKEGFAVDTLTSAKKVDVSKLRQYNLLILDVMMPDIDGFTFCKKIRDIFNAPILFLTAKTLEDEVLYIQKVRTENCSLFRRKRRLFKKFSDCT